MPRKNIVTFKEAFEDQFSLINELLEILQG